MTDALRDVAQTLRSLVHRPTGLVAAVITLALALSSTVAVFTIADAVMWRPLPFPEPERLVTIDGGAFGADRARLEVAPWMSALPGVVASGLYSAGTLNVSGPQEVRHVRAAAVSPGFFSALGVRAHRGRHLVPEDNGAGLRPAVVLSDHLWRAAFGQAPDIVGRSVLVNGRTCDVIGVMPEGFSFPNQSELWLSASIQHSPFFGGVKFGFIGRLAPWASVADVESAGNSRQPPVANTRGANLQRFRVTSLQDALAAGVRPILLLAFGAMLVVLLVACCNVAGILLVRVVARQPETTLRAALGASRWALIRQPLTEAMAIACFGGLLGILFIRPLVLGLLSWAPTGTVGMENVTTGLRVAAFGAMLIPTVGVAVGVIPAARATRGALHSVLTTGRRSATRVSWAARALVIGEMSLALVLSLCGALMMKSFLDLVRADRGFRPDGVLSFSLSLSGPSYADSRRSTAFFNTLRDRLAAVPGVDRVAATSELPTAGRLLMRVPVVTESRWSGDDEVLASYNIVTPDYFSALGIPVIRGRGFSQRDSPDSTRVAVLSHALARRLSSANELVGTRIRLGSDASEPWREVVAIVGDVEADALAAGAQPAIYLPLAQESWPRMSYVVRAGGDRGGLIARIRKEVAALDPSIPMFEVGSMPDLLADRLGGQRFAMFALSLFAGSAMVLAAIGVFGLTSYSVALRRREFGIQMALGAEPRHLRASVLRRAGVDILLAAAIGLPAGLAAANAMKAFLFGVSSVDPATATTAALAVMMASSLAAGIAARPMTRIDPAEALRAE